MWRMRQPVSRIQQGRSPARRFAIQRPARRLVCADGSDRAHGLQGQDAGVSATLVKAVGDVTRNARCRQPRGKAGRLTTRLVTLAAALLLIGLGLHLYCEAVALREAGAAWGQIGASWGRSALIGGGWCLAAVLVLAVALTVGLRALTADDARDSSEGAVTGTPKGAGTTRWREDSSPEELAPAARRILTLAATRTDVERDEWAWLEVEREAMRLLASAEEPATPGPAGSNGSAPSAVGSVSRGQGGGA